MSRLRGVIAATPTPVTEEFEPDLERLIRHCAFLLDEGGCDGINLLGTTGEATSFTVEQRLATMRAVAASGLPLRCIMVGTGAAAIGDAVRLTAAARDLGFAGALLLPPFYYKGVGGAALLGYVEEVVARAGAEGLKLYLYHFPQTTMVPWPLETVIALHGRFPGLVIGLKDSASDLDYSRALARLDGFDVFPGSEGTLGEPRHSGLAGCISATTNITGPLAKTGWRDPESEAGRRAVAEADAIRNALRGHPLVASVKWALARLKRDPAWLRVMPPLQPLCEEEGGKLAATLAGTAFTRLGEAKHDPVTQR